MENSFKLYYKVHKDLSKRHGGNTLSDILQSHSSEKCGTVWYQTNPTIEQISLREREEQLSRDSKV